MDRHSSEDEQAVSDVLFIVGHKSKIQHLCTDLLALAARPTAT
jgi:hypothetical protein